MEFLANWMENLKIILGLLEPKLPSHTEYDAELEAEYRRDHPFEDWTAERWNSHYPVGMPVHCLDIEPALRTTTAGPAECMALAGGSTRLRHVVRVVGLDDPVLLSHLSIDEPREDDMGRSPGLSGSAVGQASGRQLKADASVVASAVELAALARRMATRLSASHVGVEQDVDEISRILSLAASIEGIIGINVEGPPGVSGTRAFLQDLVSGEIYVTHFQGRSEEWSHMTFVESAGQILVGVEGKTKTADPADYGLCAYGGGSGPWHPFVWTEKVGAKVTDGKDMVAMVDAESDRSDMEVEDDEVQ